MYDERDYITFAVKGQCRLERSCNLNNDAEQEGDASVLTAHAHHPHSYNTNVGNATIAKKSRKFMSFYGYVVILYR